MTKRTTFGIALFIAMIMALTITGVVTARADTGFGASTPGGLSQADRKYGHVDVVRNYEQGLPDWGLRRSQVVSFKMSPQGIVNGQYDNHMRSWFSNAPKGPRIWWSYWHEPEDNFGSTAARNLYKRAWTRLANLADRYAPNNLKSTYIGMMMHVWNGDWGKWYPGDRNVDVLGFDGKVKSWHHHYVPARNHYADAVKLARKHNKPWGLAEMGSTVFGGNYQGRANWMRDTARWVDKTGAKFCLWWDQTDPSKNAGDYRLNDQPSISAFRSWLKQ